MSGITYQGAFFQGSRVTPAIATAARKAEAIGIPLLRANTPVRSHRLQNAWRGQLLGNGLRISNDTPYASYVENGTHRMNGKHMLSSTMPVIQAHFKAALITEVGATLGAKLSAPVETNFSTVRLNSASKPKKQNAYYRGFRK